MEQLDRQKFTLAKTINERQVALTGVEGRVDKLREEGNELVKDRKEALERSDDLDSEAWVILRALCCQSSVERQSSLTCPLLPPSLLRAASGLTSSSRSVSPFCLRPTAARARATSSSGTTTRTM